MFSTNQHENHFVWKLYEGLYAPIAQKSYKEIGACSPSCNLEKLQLVGVRLL